MRHDVHEEEGHGVTNHENEFQALGDVADFLIAHPSHPESTIHSGPRLAPAPAGSLGDRHRVHRKGSTCRDFGEPR
ncbi:hypothetical protein FHX81_8023 [Saccharothrix saharensis]|uniref:Uncharacterized protein n=1 Tax=Saccharothrix saharensis TaxID=571190 RepID=A0A543JRQ8_9PSEU|nr:hypothetical protein FHX81_8023 [Saccharothrix saharensis]